MKFETLKTGKFATKKQIIVGATAVCVVLVAAFSFYYSYAKYRAVQSVKLANGTVDFTPSDLNMVAVHWEKDGVDGNNNPANYDSKTAVPTSGYLLNTTLSTCEVGGAKDSDIGIEYAGGKVTISNLTKKGTKCYLYFDRIRDTEVPTISNVATTVTKTEINVTVTASDNMGVTEYWYQLDSGDSVKETTNTHTFTGLTAGQTYSLKVWVKDAAGNTSEVTTKSVTTTPNGQTPDTIIAAIEASSSFKSGTPTFTSVATGAETEANNGIYKVSDGMYNGSSYYWRGAATTNHVIFDSKCWRIVRINGDKSIRLIYNGTPSGTTCPGNGANASTVVLSGTAYNPTYNNSSYVGWTYTASSQRPSTANPQTSGTAAPIKTALENWYSSNISAAAKAKVVKGKFCNDRNIGSGTYSATGSTFYYAAYNRLQDGARTPTLSCPNGDVYSLDVGMITADEVQFAGASWTTTNKSYYLYNGQYYWTMSPFYWSFGAIVFFVYDDGRLNNTNVHDTNLGVRPVINLSANTLFAVGGNGTASNPYVVS